MNDWPSRKRRRLPSPQPWKLEVPRHLDLEEEYNPTEDDTQEFLITEPDDFMVELELEGAPTGKWEKLEDPNA